MPAQNRILLIIFGAFVVITTILGAGYWYLSNSQTSGPISDSLRNTFKIPRASPSPTPPPPEPTPRYLKPLPSGRQEYSISHGPDVKGPKPFRAIIDPLTPKKGERETVTLMITSDAEITEAKIILHTDNNKKEYPLKLTAGNSQNDTWETSWTMDDSYDYNYYIQFYLKSANGLFQEGLRFRQDW